MNQLQRYTFYCILLQEAEENIIEDRYTGLCSLILQVSELDCYEINLYPSFCLKTQLPELYAFKKSKCYWWPTDKEGWQQRIKALKQCIKQTHP